MNIVAVRVLRRINHASIAILLAFSLFAGVAFSKEPPPTLSADAVLDMHFERMGANDWVGVGETLDPEYLKAEREKMVTMLRELEAKAAESPKKNDQGENFGQNFALEFALAAYGGAKSVDDLQRLSDAEIWGKSVPNLQIESLTVHRIGVVTEDDNLRHVVVRIDGVFRGKQESQLDLLTMVLTPKGWRVRMDEGFGGALRSLKQSIDFQNLNVAPR